MSRERLQSVDLLRGFVMVVMALDHVRDYVSVAHFDPTDLRLTTAGLFTTRWVTHFCAPVFTFLAGTGAWLARARGKSARELSWFLLTRGLWLIVLELTVMHLAWSFQLNFGRMALITLWALGAGLVTLAGLVYLPTWAVGAVAVVMIAVHNAFDGVHGGWLVHVLHQPGPLVASPRLSVFVGYPLVPWVGVMAAGYALGPLLSLEAAARRRRWLLGLGVGAVVLFVALRALNLYGDPAAWSGQRDGLFSFFSFINVTKYPPSLDYLLVTLGPALIGLGLLDSVRVGDGNPLLVFGRVPMFYYLIHVYLIHAISVLLFYLRYREIVAVSFFQMPQNKGFSLAVVYVVWLAVVAVLYGPCRWYAGVKRRSRSVWLSYL